MRNGRTEWPRRPRCLALLLFLVLLGGGGAVTGQAVEIEETRQFLLQGEYARSITNCLTALKEEERDEEWSLLLLRSLLAVGRYPEALTAAEEALARHPVSVRLRTEAHEVFERNGQAERARAMLGEIDALFSSRGRWAYQDAPNLVALGRAALGMGLEPRRALEGYFDRAKRADPDYRESYLASGELALDKEDYALASRTFIDGLKRFPKDAEMHYGLARAYAPSDRKQMLLSIDAALTQNTNHAPSYLLVADHLIDAEDYKGAGKALERALSINPSHPAAWAYRAVIAHLKNDAAAEAAARTNALKFWAADPAVEHLIGFKLSQKYRFTEGAARQRQALVFDPKFLPAKIQLAQDLLRLGEEEEGWRLADEVHEKDQYNVEAFNLVTLRDTLGQYVTLTNEHFILRLSAREAPIWAERALALLTRAKTNLCAKYGLELPRPTVVEVFADQKDFGVRTFGMPDNPGFLGVCFGSVITANSPSTQTAHPANWEAVLWHEFCHVVTLNLTRNKMPRWLSEGISVFEERQMNPSWGQVMNPRYREMVLGEDLKKVSELSAAFLAPASDLHLQFAYYQSCLVVEFLVERYGLEALKKILRDLGEGVEINQALTQNTLPLSVLDKDFVAYARARAEGLAPALDWTKPSNRELARADDKFFADRPTNYYALQRHAQKLLTEKKWEEAKAPLFVLLTNYPAGTEAYAMLAQAHRGLNATNAERAVLERLARIDADATDAYLRLAELAVAHRDWTQAVASAQRFLAVNPLLPQPYRFLAQAAEAADTPAEAIRSYRTLLLLDPPDPAEAHFRLARLLHRTQDPAARRHVLQALEEAPRFRDAHRLLLQMVEEPARPAPPPVAPPPPPPAGKAEAPKP